MIETSYYCIEKYLAGGMVGSLSRLIFADGSVMLSAVEVLKRHIGLSAFLRPSTALRETVLKKTS